MADRTVWIKDAANNWQDVSAFIDKEGTNLSRANWTDSGNHTLVLRIPWRYVTGVAGGGYVFPTFARVISGWREGGGWLEWDCWGGYIRSVRREPAGSEMLFTITLWSYNVLLDRTVLLGFPENPFPHTFHVPPRPEDYQIHPYAIGFTAMQWLVGRTEDGAHRDGIITQALAGNLAGTGGIPVDLNGVDAAFAFSAFDLTGRPKNTEIDGHIEAVTVREAVDLVLELYVRLHPEIRPAYYMKPIVSGNDIIPQFRLGDLNADDNVDHWFSDVRPLPAGMHKYWAYWDETDASDQYTRVTVIGVGAVYDSRDAFQRKLYRRVQHTDLGHITEAPTEFQTEVGWHKVIRADQIRSNVDAAQLATLLGNASAEPRVSRGFRCHYDIDIKEGDVAKVLHRPSMGWTVEGEVGVVLSVTPVDENGLAVKEVVIGSTAPTAADILDGPIMTLLEMAGEGITRNKKGAGPNFNDPTQPWIQQLYTGNTGTRANGIRSLTDRAPGFMLRAAINKGLVDINGQPVDNTVELWEAPIVIVDDRPIPGQSIVPMPVFPVYGGEDGNELVQWFDAEGYDHPQEHLYQFVTDDWWSVVLYAPAILSTVKVVAQFDEAGDPTTITLDPEDDVFLKKWNPVTETMDKVVPAVSREHPLYVKPGDYVQVHITNLPPGHRVEVEVSERGPHEDLFHTGTDEGSAPSP